MRKIFLLAKKLSEDSMTWVNFGLSHAYASFYQNNDLQMLSEALASERVKYRSRRYGYKDSFPEIHQKLSEIFEEKSLSTILLFSSPVRTQTHLIGWGELIPESSLASRAEMGLLIREQFANRGYGTLLGSLLIEQCAQLGHLETCYADIRNSFSRRILQRLSFFYNGQIDSETEEYFFTPPFKRIDWDNI